jgi:methylmalonyl-CoA epimerase
MFKRMSHIGVVVADLDRAVGEWTERFGLREVERIEVELEGVRSAFVSPGGGRKETTCVELIEPLDKADMSNVFAKYLAERGEGLFHAAFTVDDPAAAGEQLREKDVRAIDLPPAGEGEGPRVVIHPKSANGLLIELLQAGQ